MRALMAADWNVLLLMSRGSEAVLLSGPLARLDMRGRCLSGVRDMRPPPPMVPPFEGVLDTRLARPCPTSHDWRGCRLPPELARCPPPPKRTRSGCRVSRERWEAWKTEDAARYGENHYGIWCHDTTRYRNVLCRSVTWLDISLVINMFSASWREQSVIRRRLPRICMTMELLHMTEKCTKL